MKIAIIGGGLAGLTAASLLTKHNIETIIIEKRDELGGLLKTRTIRGYTFDIGGSHIIFSRNKEILNFILDLLGRNNLIKHKRNTKIYYKDRYIHYPFENGLYMLDPIERYECIKYLLETIIKREKGEIKKPQNFEEWIYYVFGKGIAEKYLIPYNIKIWKRDLREISLEWVGERVPKPPIDDILKSAVGIPTEGYLHQLHFYYPKSGGIQFLIDNLKTRINHTNKCKILLESTIKKIQPSKKKISITTNNHKFDVDYVITTAPPQEIIPKIKDSNIDVDIISLLNKLDYNSLYVVGIGAKSKPAPYHWIYFPQKEIIFHRLAYISNYSLDMTKEGGVSMIAEISLNPKSKVPDTAKIKDIVKENLDKIGLVGINNIEVCKAWYWKYAYIIYNHHYKDVIKQFIEKLQELKIIPLGRFGSWNYMNMDSVISQAITIVNKILTRKLIDSKKSF